MAGIGSTNRWNVHKLSPYEQLQFYRDSRATAREQMAKLNAQANGLNSIQVQSSVEMGNIVSKIAMARMARKFA